MEVNRRLQKEKSKLENAQNELDQAKVLLKAKVDEANRIVQEGRGTNNYRHVFFQQGFAGGRYSKSLTSKTQCCI